MGVPPNHDPAVLSTAELAAVPAPPAATDTPAISTRRGVVIATAITFGVMAAFETIKEVIVVGGGFAMTRVQSHVVTVIVSTLVAAIGAAIALRRQSRLSARVAEESSARARLEEVQRRLVQRTAELERSHASLAAEINDRRRIEEELRRSQASQAATLDALPDLLVTVGRDGFFRGVHIPPDLRPRFGTDAAWVGRHVAERLPPDVAVQALERINACLATGTPQLLEAGIPSSAGEVHYYEIRVVRQDRETVLGLVRDVSAAHRLERELTQAQKMESIGRLAGGVAHDFNNLLTAILTHAEFALADVPPSHAMREDLEGIKHAAGLGAQLTRKLLSFARKQPLQPRPVDVAALVRELDVVLRRTVGATIVVDTRLDVDTATVIADPGQLEQVVINLAVNARDAMPDGGTLTVTVARATDAGPHAPTTPAAGWVVLRVRDSGVGMDAATRERVFEPFFTTKPPGQGTGLGLAICYGIAQRAGGHITLDSAPGAGTEVAIYLPAAVEPNATDGAHDERLVGGDETILVCEDDPAVRAGAVRALRRHGYEVITAVDGQDALDVAAAYEGRIHLLLNDVLMPRMGGPETAKLMRAARPGIRVLFMSGYTAGVVLGDTGHETRLLPKPFTMPDLVRTVREVLGPTLRLAS
jgi:signal transduction histidine kinase/CheY-like chemotaxis protein